MSFTPEQVKELQAPLARANVKERTQAGRSLSYIEAYHAENEANRIFGFDAWDRETKLTLISEHAKSDKFGNEQWRVYYRAKVRITVRTPDGQVVVREGCGYGSGIDKDLGQAHESALKEAESDAEKRALKTFGNPFGQALYDKKQSEVEEAPAKPAPAQTPDSAGVSAAKVAINLCATSKALEEWGQKNSEAIKQMEPEDQRRVRAHYMTRLNVLRDEVREVAA